jgi:hypothetical protein
MTEEELHTLVGCDLCGREFRYRDLVDIGEGVVLCPECMAWRRQMLADVAKWGKQ